MAALIQTLAVAEYRNIRHAATALGLNQAGVSARVRTLEQDLGVRLFERHARGVTLTEAGEHFVDGIAAGLDQIDHTLRTIGAMARGESGRLRIGVHALIPGSVLADLVDRYRKQHPSIHVVIAEGTARESVTQLRAGELDLTFVAGSPERDCQEFRVWAGG
ncbi:LysR family transcriptional regulator [Aureimonas altamirensis]|uniref:LysR family transcriptional regulator n=1 Tax=Aureimonas altamirensis TaxID=370622 RepID=UPI00203736BB|nr:LysR family transcriptional regulator [Aureimonas altamirensis]MCM2505521.1 LysR family transcriptional regulator [Aureimonas altamirensis]